MVVGRDIVSVDGDRVSVSRGGVEVARGRWYSGRITDRSGALGDGGDIGEADAWRAIETAVRQESEGFVEATRVAAHDARGVDVTQIDRMLALTPRERLNMLESQCRSIQRLLNDEPPH